MRKASICQTGRPALRIRHGSSTSPDQTAKVIADRNLRNSIFVDVTADAGVVEMSSAAASEGAFRSSPVTRSRLPPPLKILVEGPCARVQREFSFRNQRRCRPPVINTLNDLMRSGDHVNRIEAVLTRYAEFRIQQLRRLAAVRRSRSSGPE